MNSVVYKLYFSIKPILKIIKTNNVGKSIETEEQITGCQGLGEGRWAVTAGMDGVSFGGDRNVLELDK